MASGIGYDRLSRKLLEQTKKTELWNAWEDGLCTWQEQLRLAWTTLDQSSITSVVRTWMLGGITDSKWAWLHSAVVGVLLDQAGKTEPWNAFERLTCAHGKNSLHFPRQH